MAYFEDQKAPSLPNTCGFTHKETFFFSGLRKEVRNEGKNQASTDCLEKRHNPEIVWAHTGGVNPGSLSR